MSCNFTAFFATSLSEDNNREHFDETAAATAIHRRCYASSSSETTNISLPCADDGEEGVRVLQLTAIKQQLHSFAIRFYIWFMLTKYIHRASGFAPDYCCFSWFNQIRTSMYKKITQYPEFWVRRYYDQHFLWPSHMNHIITVCHSAFRSCLKVQHLTFNLFVKWLVYYA